MLVEMALGFKCGRKLMVGFFGTEKVGLGGLEDKRL
jgi:hypothetical protein